MWEDKIRPTLKTLGLPWVNYQVLRRSTASLMNQLGIDGKTVADQLGHGLNVSQNVYTQAGITQQANAVQQLDAALAAAGTDGLSTATSSRDQSPDKSAA